MALREVKRLEVEVQQLRGQNKMLSRATEELLLQTPGTGRSGGRTTDKFPESVDPECIVVVESFGHRISPYGAAKVPEPNNGSYIPQLKCHVKRDRCAELCAVITGDCREVQHPPQCIVASGWHYQPSFRTTHKTFRMLVRVWVKQMLWKEMILKMVTRKKQWKI